MLRVLFVASLFLFAQEEAVNSALTQYFKSNTQEEAIVIPVLVRGEPYDLHLKLREILPDPKVDGPVTKVRATFDDLRYDPGSGRFNDYELEFQLLTKGLKVQELKTRLVKLNGVEPKPLPGAAPPPPKTESPKRKKTKK